jgi:hypothetical protein
VVDLIPSVPSIDGDDSLKNQSRGDLNTIHETFRGAINDLNSRKANTIDIPNQQRSSWDWLNIDRDFSSSYDNSVGWSGAFDTAMGALGEGGTLTLGPKAYPHIHPLRWTRRGQRILGTGSEYYTYPSNITGSAVPQALTGCRLVAMQGFSGEAQVIAYDATLNNGYEPANCSIVGVGIDGGSVRPSANGAAGLVGILIKGLVRAVQVLEVNMIQTSGEGLLATSYGSSGPRGGRFRDIQVWSAGTSTTPDHYGFWFNGLTDAKIHGLLAVSNEAGGIRVTSPGQLIMGDIHSVFNKGGHGMLIDGPSGNGGWVLTGYESDRNAQDGLCVSAWGTGQHGTIMGAELRRDGSNGDDGQGGGGWAGLAFRGQPGQLVAPVQALGLSINVEDNDSNNGVMTPSDFGVYATYLGAGSVIQGNVIWGRDNSIFIEDNSTGALGIMDEGTRFYKGTASTKARVFPDIKRGKETFAPLPLGPGQFVIPSGTPGDPSVGAISYRYGNSSAFYTAHDLRRAGYMKITAGVTSAGPTGSYLRPQFTTDLTGASGWTYFDAASANLTMDGTGLRNNFGWSLVPAAAKTDVLVRVLGMNGDGSTAIAFAHLTFHTRL